MYSRTIACDQKKNKALKINLMPCSIYSGGRVLLEGFGILLEAEFCSPESAI